MPPIEIGVLMHLGDQPEQDLAKVTGLGLKACQVCTWQEELWTEETASRLRRAADAANVRMTTVWTGYSGPKTWNFIDGPKTIGLVPPAYRQRRLAELMKGAEFAQSLGVGSITTHMGFIPEDPNDPVFGEVVEAIRTLADHCGRLGIELWFETGQETPVTLLRTIQRVGTDNLGVNLDPANLILYGRGNPVDAMDVIGPYVRDVHAKDGLYPTDGERLGLETPLGEGKVDFPALVARLKELGFAGTLCIEREISGEEQIRDIRKAIEFLTPLC